MTVNRNELRAALAEASDEINESIADLEDPRWVTVLVAAARELLSQEPRQPMSDEEIEAMRGPAQLCIVAYKAGARAAERHHGVTPNV